MDETIDVKIKQKDENSLEKNIHENDKRFGFVCEKARSEVDRACEETKLVGVEKRVGEGWEGEREENREGKNEAGG